MSISPSYPSFSYCRPRFGCQDFLIDSLGDRALGRHAIAISQACMQTATQTYAYPSTCSAPPAHVPAPILGSDAEGKKRKSWRMPGRGEVSHLCASHTHERLDGAHASPITLGHRLDDEAAPSPLHVRCNSTPLQNSCRKPLQHSNLQRAIHWARSEAGLAASSPRHRHHRAVPLARNIQRQPSLPIIFRRLPFLHAWPLPCSKSLSSLSHPPCPQRILMYPPYSLP
jgi:hypothetical protein